MIASREVRKGREDAGSAGKITSREVRKVRKVLRNAWSLVELEPSQPRAEVMRNRRECAEVPFGVERVFQQYLRRMEQGTADGLEKRILDGFGAVLAVAHDGVPSHGEVAADLVGSAGLDPQKQVASPVIGPDASYLGKGSLILDGEVQRRGRGIPALVDDGTVGLADVVDSEDGDGGVEGRVASREEKAACGVAVETVDGAQRGGGALEAENGLCAGVRALGDDAGGLVDDEVVGILDENAELGRARGNGGGGGNADGQANDVAAVQSVVRHPDATVVHPDGAGIDLLLRGAAGDAERFGEVVLEGGVGVLRRNGPLFGLRRHGGMFSNSSLFRESTLWRAKSPAVFPLRGPASSCICFPRANGVYFVETPSLEFPMPTPSPDKEPSFEQSLEQLESIVAAMEAGELGLDEMIAKFEEGQKLLARCQKRLTEVERKVEALVKAADGSVTTAPFDENALNG